MIKSPRNTLVDSLEIGTLTSFCRLTQMSSTDTDAFLSRICSGSGFEIIRMFMLRLQTTENHTKCYSYIIKGLLH